jgi:hypothetical protein
LSETELRIATRMAEKCCLNCANMLVCPDILTYKCKKYETGEPDKSALSIRYLDVLERIVDLVKELQMTEAAMSLSEKKNLIPKEKTQAEQTKTKENGAEAKETHEKPAISKSNKEILKLIEMGRGIKEIAEELNLKPETVAVELEYLLKTGMIKAKPM